MAANVSELSCSLFHIVGAYLRGEAYGVNCKPPTDIMWYSNLLLAVQSGCTLPECLECSPIPVKYVPPGGGPFTSECNLTLTLTTVTPSCNPLTFVPV